MRGDTMGADVVDRWLEGVQNADVGSRDVFADDAVLDATVPGWRFSLRGAERIEAQFDHWYADVGRFEELERVSLPGGELVRFFLTWKEAGVPHAAHQAHLLMIRDDRIVADTMFCGGRWPASLLAEMEAEALAHRG